MSFLRGIGGPSSAAHEPGARAAGVHEHERRLAWTRRLGTGTLACPRCDVPVAIGPVALAPSAMLDCPFCSHRAALRTFLTLAAPGQPARPARVVLRVVARTSTPG
jgi:hypothetical protein